MKINLLLLILLFFSINCNNKIFPSIGGDIINPYLKVNNNNKKYLEQKSIIVSNNYSFQINTTNMDEKCSPECYLNCQTQFIDVIKEKYCIINVCKCDIVNEKSSSGHYKGKKKKNTFFGFFLQKDYDNNLNYNKNDILIEGWVYVLFVIFILYEYFVNKYFYTKKNKELYQEMENMNLYQKLISEEPLE